MQLTEYFPKQNYILFKIIEQEKTKGGIYLPPGESESTGRTPMAKVLKAGPKCENVIEGEVIIIDTMAYAKQVYLEDFPTPVYTCTEHVAVGGYIPKE